MAEAVVSGEDTFCLLINNGDDLLNLKRFVSKKTDKGSQEQKLDKSVETISIELIENHNKTDSIHFDVNNTLLSEPNVKMDSYAEGNITVGTICIQEDQDTKTIDISDENSNEADVNNSDNDIQILTNNINMREAVVSEEDTFCFLINNGDDLLNLKRVVSKKTDKGSQEQKLNKSVETISIELNENHNKTDSIHFDVDNTLSSEPNVKMDSYADGNITDGLICTQEDQETKTIDISDENSNEVDVNNSEKDIEILTNNIKMREAVVSGEDTVCFLINNGDDLLNLKRVASKKTDKGSQEQKLNKSVETIGSELIENHNKTDSIYFDVNNTLSSEPNVEMDSYADGNITDGLICTQEDQETKTIDISDENSNEVDVNNSEKDIEVNSIKCLDVPYSLSNSLYDNDSQDLEDDDSELNNIRSPTSYFNISARAPLRSYKDLDSMFENDNFLLTKEQLSNERKRKFEYSAEEVHKSTKIFKLKNLMKYPFQKKTYGTLISEDKSNISMAEIIVKEENTIEPEPAVYKNNSDNAKTEKQKKNTQINVEAAEEIEDTSINVNKRKFCNIM